MLVSLHDWYKIDYWNDKEIVYFVAVHIYIYTLSSFIWNKGNVILQLVNMQILFL